MIVKTARKLEIGDELLPWANTDEEHDEFGERIDMAKDEIRKLPSGAKSITFLMKKEYRNLHSQNTRILYKRTVNAFNPKTGAPDYKDHMLKFNWGMIRTSNYEEIAFLDMHNKWFMREANRELTKEEKLAKENEELKAKLAALTDIEKQKTDIVNETKDMEQKVEQIEDVSDIKFGVDPNAPQPIRVEVKEKGKRGRPKKS